MLRRVFSLFLFLSALMAGSARVQTASSPQAAGLFAPWLGPAGPAAVHNSTLTGTITHFWAGDKPTGGDRSDNKPDRKQLKINKAVKALLEAMKGDPSCVQFLGSKGTDPIQTLESTMEHGLIGYGPLAGDLAAVSGSEGGVGVAGLQITLGQYGPFFQGFSSGPDGLEPLSVGESSVMPRGIPGGTPKAQAEILLHELGHNTRVLKDDFNNDEAIGANDAAIEKNCAKTLSRFRD